jgi:hypothetical protein
MADVFKVKKARETGGTLTKTKGTLDSIHQTHIETLKKKMDCSAIKDLEERLERMLKEREQIPNGSFEFDHVYIQYQQRHI